MIVVIGIVELAGSVLYRRRFFVERDGWRWFWKRGGALMADGRPGEVVTLVDADGEAIARLACTKLPEAGHGSTGAEG